MILGEDTYNIGIAPYNNEVDFGDIICIRINNNEYYIISDGNGYGFGTGNGVGYGYGGSGGNGYSDGFDCGNSYGSGIGVGLTTYL